jgi:hypothetical protein
MGLRVEEPVLRIGCSRNQFSDNVVVNSETSPALLVTGALSCQICASKILDTLCSGHLGGN